jgi:hypothetical protein
LKQSDHFALKFGPQVLETVLKVYPVDFDKFVKFLPTQVLFDLGETGPPGQKKVLQEHFCLENISCLNHQSHFQFQQFGILVKQMIYFQKSGAFDDLTNSAQIHGSAQLLLEDKETLHGLLEDGHLALVLGRPCGHFTEVRNCFLRDNRFELFYEILE